MRPDAVRPSHFFKTFIIACSGIFIELVYVASILAMVLLISIITLAMTR